MAKPHYLIRRSLSGRFNFTLLSGHGRVNGVSMNKGLTLQTGQTHMVRYMKPLMERIQNGDIDPSFIISHRSTNLEDGPALYDLFRDKKDNCTKVVFKLHG